MFILKIDSTASKLLQASRKLTRQKIVPQSPAPTKTGRLTIRPMFDLLQISDKYLLPLPESTAS
jgi:hypothetical protein